MKLGVCLNRVGNKLLLLFILSNCTHVVFCGVNIARLKYSGGVIGMQIPQVLRIGVWRSKISRMCL